MSSIIKFEFLDEIPVTMRVTSNNLFVNNSIRIDRIGAYCEDWKEQYGYSKFLREREQDLKRYIYCCSNPYKLWQAYLKVCEKRNKEPVDDLLDYYWEKNYELDDNIFKMAA